MTAGWNVLERLGGCVRNVSSGGRCDVCHRVGHAASTLLPHYFHAIHPPGAPLYVKGGCSCSSCCHTAAPRSPAPPSMGIMDGLLMASPSCAHAPPTSCKVCTCNGVGGRRSGMVAVWCEVGGRQFGATKARATKARAKGHITFRSVTASRLDW